MDSLVLASGSARRSEILKSVGLSFSITSSDIDESVLEKETPLAYLSRITKSKMSAATISTPSVVLTADTIVVLDNIIYGKPINDQDAINTLKKLSGKTHQVYTGFYLKHFGKNIDYSEVVTTHVTFNSLSDAEIEGYIRSKEPFGKAGSYAIQGVGAFLVNKIDGCYFNVVGLPISSVLKGLKSISDITIF